MRVPDFYEHYCPTKIVAGQRAVSNIPFEIGRFGSKKAMIILNKTVAESGFLKLIEQAFTDSDREIGAVYDEVKDRASMRMSRKIAQEFTGSGCDCFIAVGGGSPMDAAKAARILAATGAQDLPAGDAGLSATGPAKIYAVPVTYTAGYQVTGLAEIYDEEKNALVFARSEQLIPYMAVLDPKATLKTGPKARAAYAMDALSRAVEASILPGFNPVAAIYAKASIGLVRKYLKPAVDGSGPSGEADKAMANASLYAGIAFSHASTGIIAAAAHALSLTAGIEAGTASAVLLPWGLDFYAASSGPQIMELAGNLAGSTRFLAEEKQIGVVKDGITSLRGLTGLPESLREAGVLKDQLKKTAGMAASTACPYYSDAAFTVQDVLTLLEKAF